jgi:hypothetical protein
MRLASTLTRRSLIIQNRERRGQAAWQLLLIYQFQVGIDEIRTLSAFHTATGILVVAKGAA